MAKSFLTMDTDENDEKCGNQWSVANMKKKISIIALLAIASSALAIFINQFKSWSGLIKQSPDIIIAQCTSTLGRVFWSWSASTIKTGDNLGFGGTWSSPTYQVNGPSSPDDSDEFPLWLDIYNP